MNASPEIAFRALIDETKLTQWFSNERTVPEPQVGGAWMVKKCRYYTGKIHTIRGKVLEIVQDKKLSYTWNVDEYPDIPETIIAWRIEHLDGGTRSEIMLVHSDLTKTLTMQIEFGLTSFGGLQSTANWPVPEGGGAPPSCIGGLLRHLLLNLPSTLVDKNPIINSAMAIQLRMGNCLLPLLFVVDFLPYFSWPCWSCYCLFLLSIRQDLLL